VVVGFLNLNPKRFGSISNLAATHRPVIRIRALGIALGIALGVWLIVPVALDTYDLFTRGTTILKCEVSEVVDAPLYHGCLMQQQIRTAANRHSSSPYILWYAWRGVVSPGEIYRFAVLPRSQIIVDYQRL
jgi:hypothetical protein